jgi:RecA DNA recombination protein
MRAALESLLRARKLDVTLLADVVLPPDRVAPVGRGEVDAPLGGGIHRGHLSEITGATSTGRTTLAVQALAAATSRGEVAALVDTCDTFDPSSAAARGVDLARLLWVRDRGDASRALKAFSLVLQAGGFGLVLLDLADVPSPVIRRFPWTTWMRIARLVEGCDTAAVLIGAERIARSPGGATIAFESAAPTWMGSTHRARVFERIASVPRVVRAR